MGFLKFKFADPGAEGRFKFEFLLAALPTFNFYGVSSSP
jgi:hypothetical protein